MMIQTIWYKNWMNEWVIADCPPTKQNLQWVRKNLAQNGVCEIFTNNPNTTK